MAYAVTLNLSRDSAARVVRVWESLAREGISSVMLEVRVQPHISLAVFEDLAARMLREAPEVLRGDLSRFAELTRPLPVNLASAGTFPTAEGVVFLAPVVTQELLEAHRRFHSTLRDRGVNCMEYYLPGNWVPHCTVATGVAPASWGQRWRCACRVRPLARWSWTKWAWWNSPRRARSMSFHWAVGDGL